MNELPVSPGPKIEDSLTRRRFIVGGLAAELLLAACGNPDERAWEQPPRP